MSEPTKPLCLADRIGLTVEEAAKVLGVSERHLRSILPEIPHTRLGGRVVVPVDDLRRWLSERARAGPSRVDQIVDEELQHIGRKA